MADNQVSTLALVLIAVVPVLTGATLTAGFGYVSQRRIDRRDHSRWLRERRYDAYTEFVRTATEYVFTRNGLSLGGKAQASAVLAAATRAQIVATKETSEAIGNFMHMFPRREYSNKDIGDAFATLRQQLLDEMVSPLA